MKCEEKKKKKYEKNRRYGNDIGLGHTLALKSQHVLYPTHSHVQMFTFIYELNYNDRAFVA